MPGQVFFSLIICIFVLLIKVTILLLLSPVSTVTTMQWEYQVGPSVGIEAGDHIWASRYILEVIYQNFQSGRFSTCCKLATFGVEY